MISGLWVDAADDVKKGESISSAYAQGTRSFLLSNDEELIHTISSLPDAVVYAIAPDVTSYVRDLTKYGMVGMAWKKIRSIGFVNLLRLFLPVLKKARSIMKKDFKVLLPLLVRLDYVQLRSLRPKIIFLHYQMTDLALANDNKALLAAVLALTRKEKNLKLGLMTKNLSLLERKMTEWDLSVQYILAPFNHKGHGMRDSQKACEQLIKTTGKEYYSFGMVVESEMKKEWAYLQKIGVKEGFLRRI